jgi:hypothetical protein
MMTAMIAMLVVGTMACPGQQGGEDWGGALLQCSAGPPWGAGDGPGIEIPGSTNSGYLKILGPLPGSPCPCLRHRSKHLQGRLHGLSLGIGSLRPWSSFPVPDHGVLKEFFLSSASRPHRPPSPRKQQSVWFQPKPRFPSALALIVVGMSFRRVILFGPMEQGTWLSR